MQTQIETFRVNIKISQETDYGTSNVPMLKSRRPVFGQKFMVGIAYRISDISFRVKFWTNEIIEVLEDELTFFEKLPLINPSF